MNLLFRLIRVVIAALLRPRLDMLDTSELTLRVWPNDLDLNLHMNNGRYFTVMDLGRIDLMIRTGVARWMWRRKWTPVVASETMRFPRALKPFQRYRLKTRVLCWDERWIFLENGECYLRRMRDQQVQISWSETWSGAVGSAWFWWFVYRRKTAAMEED